VCAYIISIFLKQIIIQVMLGISRVSSYVIEAYE